MLGQLMGGIPGEEPDPLLITAAGTETNRLTWEDLHEEQTTDD
jgi:hypothetical protein